VVSALREEELRIQKELQKAKMDIDLINQEVEENLKLHEQIKAQALQPELEHTMPDPNDQADNMFMLEKTLDIEKNYTSIETDDMHEAIGILSDPVAL